MVRRMQDQETTYIRKDREIEVEEQMIKDINSLSEQDADAHSGALDNKTPKNHESARAHLQ